MTALPIHILEETTGTGRELVDALTDGVLGQELDRGLPGMGAS